MNLRSLDLNLLVILDAIYKEGNVTRAASRVGLSQPATSNALTRLRGHLKDELFLRSPDGLRPTPRVLELAPQLHTLLTELEYLLDPVTFDPETAVNSITIAAVDYFSVVIIPPLLNILTKEAPGIRIQVIPSVGRSLEALDNGDIDFASATLSKIPERFGHARMIEDRYVCLVRKGHPLAEQGVTLRQYAKMSHLLVSPIGDPKGFVDVELAKSGLTREISLVLSEFSAAPPVVASSDLVLTAPARLLNQLVTPKHVILDCPVETPLQFRSLDLIWHDRLSRHPAKEWIRNAIFRAAENASKD